MKTLRPLGKMRTAKPDSDSSNRWRYFEARAGFGDTPDAKLTVGLGF